MTQPHISPCAEDLIVYAEITSEDWFNRHLQAPTRPAGESGVTIGIGEDLGQQTPAQVHAVWDGLLPAATVARLAQCAGVRGEKATPMAAALADIRVPYAAARQVFLAKRIPACIAEVIHAMPNAVRLPPHCLGALVSIDFNRGPAWSVLDDRHREMRAIAAALAMARSAADLAVIPIQIRAMKRLWVTNPEAEPHHWVPLPGLAGLLARRDAEAILFADGLAEFAAAAPPADASPTAPAPAAPALAQPEPRG